MGAQSLHPGLLLRKAGASSRFGFVVAAAFFVWNSASPPAHAQLIINPTFDSSVTSLPDAGAYEAAVDYAIAQIETLYVNPITINIDIAASSDPSILGQSETELYGTLTYSQLVGALDASATDATDNLAYSHLPATDPTSGGSFAIAGAEAQALGLLPANLAASDGTFTFGTSFTYALNPSDRAVAGEYDFIGIAEHEITEIMGRIPGLDTESFPYNLPFDLFRYTAPGTLAVDDNGAGVYYSIDGGQTDLMNFNDAALFGEIPRTGPSATTTPSTLSPAPAWKIPCRRRTSPRSTSSATTRPMCPSRKRGRCSPPALRCSRPFNAGRAARPATPRTPR